MDLESDISPTTVWSLLGFTSRDRVFKSRSIRLGALAVNAIEGALFEPFPVDIRARDRLLWCMFLIILRGYFLGNNSSIVHFSFIGALRDVDRIGDYDWGSFTFAYFLHSMRIRYEGQTDTWLDFYPFLLVGFSHLTSTFFFVFFLSFLLM